MDGRESSYLTTGILKKNMKQNLKDFGIEDDEDSDDGGLF